MTQSDQIEERVRINGKPPETGEDMIIFRCALPETGEPSTRSLRIQPPRIVQGDEVRLTSRQANQTTLAGLYNFGEALSPSLRNGITLLGESINVLEQAKEAVEADDKLMAQDAITRLRPVLMELFCCRDIGDGFGEIVRACQVAVLNLGDDTPSRDQVVELKWVLSRIRKEPFISFEDAVVPVISLENSGLVVDEVSVTEIVPAADE